MANNFGLTAYRGDTGQQFKPRTGFKSWLMGNPDMFMQIPRHSPEVSGSINDLIQSTFQGLQNPSQGFQPIADEAIHRFETQGVPSLAERFTAMGGGQRSSGFQNALASGRGDLERSLGAMQAQYGLQNRSGLLDQLKLGLLNQPEYAYSGRQGGALQNILGPVFGNYASQFGGQGAGEFVKFLAGLLPYLL